MTVSDSRGERERVEPTLYVVSIATVQGRSSEDLQMVDSRSRTYHFVTTFEADDDHLAFDDPEWAADAAFGFLTNEYGLRATYSEPEAVSGDKLLRRRPSSPPG